MERQAFEQEVLDFVEARAAFHRAAADAGADDDLLQTERRNRTEVLGPKCRVKAGDDVLHNGEVVRVIGAARGEGWFYGLQPTPWGTWSEAPMEARFITSRAPADPDEVPLPIFEGGAQEEEEHPEPDPIDPAQLEALRAGVIKQVDVVSTALIRAGFVFEGITFSMTNEAQIRYLGMQAEPEMLPYPLPINSKDDSVFLLLQSEEHTRSFCRGAKLHVMGVVATGTIQKQVVRSLQTLEALRAYHDPRADALLPAAVADAEDALAAASGSDIAL